MIKLTLRSILFCAWFVLGMTLPTRAAGPVTAAAMAPCGKHVVLGSAYGVEVRSWPELAVTAALSTDLINVHDLSFSPDGLTLLAAGGAPAEEGVVEVLAWPGGKIIRRVVAHQDLVYRVAWSPDSKRWATAGADGVCQVFDAHSGQRLVRYTGHSSGVLSLRYLPDNQTIISAGIDQTLRLWDSTNGRQLRTLDNHVGSVNDIAVRPREPADPAPAMVASISEDSTVRLWQPQIGRLMRFARLPSIPRALAWSPTGDRLFLACDDGQIRVLDPDNANVIDQWAALQGRIYELVMDGGNDRLLVAGEAGTQTPCGLYVSATQQN